MRLLSFSLSPQSRLKPIATITLVALLAANAPAFAKPKVKTPPVPGTGDVLISGGVGSDNNTTASAEFYSVAEKKFFTTGAMSTARAGHQLVWFQTSSERTTNSGVAIGGFIGSAGLASNSLTFNLNPLNSIDVYTLSPGAFAADNATGADTMQAPRALFTSIALPGDSTLTTDPSLGGHVIALAGLCDATALEDCRSADIIHPSDDHTSPTSNPKVAVFLNTLTYLDASQTVLMAGGFSDLVGSTTNSAEIYNPGAGETFALTANPMVSARAGHTATELPDGTVLITGGMVNSNGTLTSTKTAEIYDPVAGTFSAVTSNMNAGRFGHTATLLSDGTVLIAGGFSGSATLAVTSANNATSMALGNESGTILNTAEIYNPGTKTFSCVGGVVKKTGQCKATMKSSRFEQTATALDDGTVLLAGGFGSAKKNSAITELNTAEVFKKKSFAKTGALNSARALAAATKILP